MAVSADSDVSRYLKRCEKCHLSSVAACERVMRCWGTLPAGPGATPSPRPEAKMSSSSGPGILAGSCRPRHLSCTTYRCQTHHTPSCDGRLALDSTSPLFFSFSPLYTFKVHSECSIVVTYIGPVCLMARVCERARRWGTVWVWVWA